MMSVTSQPESNRALELNKVSTWRRLLPNPIVSGHLRHWAQAMLALKLLVKSLAATENRIG